MKHLPPQAEEGHDCAEWPTCKGKLVLTGDSWVFLGCSLRPGDHPWRKANDEEAAVHKSRQSA